ncbi:replication-associated recombination protein A [Candidatus Omnitrophota bacterium]
MQDTLFNGLSDYKKTGTESFDSIGITATSRAPLATVLRPSSLEEFIGQEHLMGEGKALRKIIDQDKLKSLIFYGPPGTGKTTLAFIISKITQSYFEKINAVLSNVAELKKILHKARDANRVTPQKKFIVFIDEIHRFNKAQQDVLMPSVESGLIVLIGATTHNPFFSVNGPLLSRSMIFELKTLEEEDLCAILRRGIVHFQKQDERMIKINDEEIGSIARYSTGDARRALNTLELALWLAYDASKEFISIKKQHVEEALQKRIIAYDKNGDQHYDTISAFIKSIRGSDPDAAVYWLAKMLYAGEDIRFIVRRMVILASEDIGNANPNAIIVATSCLNAVEFVGLPEARIILSQCATYLATSPKSNAAYAAINEAQHDIENEKVDHVPDHLKGTGYAGAKILGHGEGYEYPHSFKGNFVEQEYRENTKKYYHPSNNGYEKRIQEYMKNLKS